MEKAEEGVGFLKIVSNETIQTRLHPVVRMGWPLRTRGDLSTWEPAAWPLSLVVDLERIIEKIGFHITQERFEKEGIILTPTGQGMYWDGYRMKKNLPF